MDKIMVLLIAGLVVSAVLFVGCTQVTPGNAPITNDAQASDAVADVGSDIEGISNSLDDIDNTLSS